MIDCNRGKLMLGISSLIAAGASGPFSKKVSRKCNEYTFPRI